MQMEQMSREEGKAVLSVYLKNGSQELRNKLIVHFLPIVRSAAAQLRGMSGSSTEEEDLIEIDIPNHKIQLLVQENEIKRRKEAWIPKEQKLKKGYLRRYAGSVTSGSQGAVLE